LEERPFYLSKSQRSVANYFPNFTAGFAAFGTSRYSPSCTAGRRIFWQSPFLSFFYQEWDKPLPETRGEWTLTFKNRVSYI